MSMKEMLKEHLGEALIPKAAPIIQELSNTITTNVPDKMKHTISVSVLMSYASQFRRNALLKEGTSVPANFISFIIAGSGDGKDSSYKIASKPFKESYNTINEYVHQELVLDAINKAEEAGESAADSEAIYNSYIKPHTSTKTVFTTAPGLIAMANEVMDLPLGAPLVTTSEISDEYVSNKDTDELIKTIATVYDLGDADAKITKGKEFRSQELSGVPMSALMIGSYSPLIHNESTRNKFITSFSSKLARRAFFVFSKESILEPTFSSTSELLEYLHTKDTKAEAHRKDIETHLSEITDWGIKNSNTPIIVTDEVDDMFKIYKRYNNDYIEESTNSDSLNSLVRRHNQWRALKLATMLAFMDMSDTIEVKHYTQAIQFVELLSADMEEFELEIHKADHERFSEFIRTLVTPEGKAYLSVHELKKQNFVKSTSRNKLQELVNLANGYDSSGTYSITTDDSGIEYEPLIKTDVLGISFKPIDCTALNQAIEANDYDAVRKAKHDISVTTAYGFEVDEASFEGLATLLEGDYAYSPFKFANGVRGKNNILGGAAWLTLDVDETPVSASEAHFMLSDLNHYIALSSDPNNEYKYRVILELDTNVQLSPVAWKHFYLRIAEDLGIKVDPLPQSQIFFSYAGRPVLSVTDADPIVTRDYIIEARQLESQKSSKQSTLTSSQKSALLQDPSQTFSFLFEAKEGEGSRSMIRAAYYAKELGASLDDTISLLKDANEYWLNPMNHERFGLIVKQVERMF